MYKRQGLALAVQKPVFFLDVETDKLTDISGERLRAQRIRLAHIEKAKSCSNFGIIVSTKPGQQAIKSAEKIKKKLDNAGKNSWILVADEITPEKLLGLRIDCLVDCACPRIADDSQYFKKPILRPEDIDEL